MKNILLLSLLLIGLKTRAQFIQQLSVIPSNPTTNDQVMVLVDAGFSSGTCQVNSQWGGFSTSNRNEASTIHCIGMLTYICYDTDTFYLGSLSAGNYRFVITVDAGAYPAPCTPGILPGVMDSIDFNVSPATGLMESGAEEFIISPNPAKDRIRISGNFNESSGFFVISDMQGKVVLQKQSTSQELDISFLSSGLYYVRYFSDKGLSKVTKLLLN